VIRACDDHGLFDASRCPTCGAPGRDVLDDDRRTRLSKFLSGALRHFPADAGIELAGGDGPSSTTSSVPLASGTSGATRERVAAVAATDPKGRFEREGGRIRAAFGHSVDVSVDDETDPEEIPGVLYHGTAPGNVGSIREDGIEPMGRQCVHLSGTVDGAVLVGLRHDDDPVVRKVDATAMVEDGYNISKRGPETFTTEWVPPRYLAMATDR